MRSKTCAAKDVRGRALLCFGMASCVRRSEIAALDASDVIRAPQGLRVTIRRAKAAGLAEMEGWRQHRQTLKVFAA